MPETLGSMKARVARWSRESIDDLLAEDAVNDGVESLWLSLVTINLSSFVGGPVQNPVFAAASERASIVSLADPVAAPTINFVVEGALPIRGVVGGYTLVTESGSQTLLSPTTSATIPANSIANMVSPAFVSGAIGWYPYMGSVNGRLALQSDAPIPFGTNWTEPDTGFIDDPGRPTPPTQNLTADDIFYIKVLEVQNSNGTWTRWQGQALEGLMMERMEKTIANTSTYMPYCYDFINGHTVEIRPAAGATLTPRYFYTQKPRRLRFANSPLPFSQYAGATEYVGDYALSKIMMGLKEFDSAQGFRASAETLKIAILESANLQNRSRATRITPYLR